MPWSVRALGNRHAPYARSTKNIVLSRVETTLPIPNGSSEPGSRGALPQTVKWRFMTSLRLLLLAVPCVFAQNSLHVASPDGRIDFHLSVFQPPEPGSLLRLGYEVSFQGKPLLNTSYLGFLVHNQEPLLGENLGLTASKSGKGD